MERTLYKNSCPTLWDNFFNDFHAPLASKDVSPNARALDEGNAVTIELELPGVKKEDINVSVENAVLTVTASKNFEKKEETKTYFNEISYGEYKRSFRLSDEIESEPVEASFEDGVLKLELKKKEKALPRRIAIK